MNNKKLDSITHLNFVMTLLVLIIHTRAYPVYFPSVPLWYEHFYRITSDITAIAVPSFFAISAYLLFMSYDINGYVKKVKSRIRSLVIPYIIFSVVGIILFNVRKLVLGEEGVWSLPDIISEIYYCSHNQPLWYVRSLFYFVLSSIVLLAVFRYLKVVGFIIVLALSIVVNCCYNIDYDSFAFWLPVLTVYSYLGYKKMPISIFTSYSTWAYAIMAFVFCCMLVVFHGVDESSSTYWIYRMAVPFVVIPFGNLVKFKPHGIYRYTFVMYLTHGILVPFVTFFFKDRPFNLPAVVLIPVISIMLTLICAIVLSKIPRLYKILNGGR